ncbi:putative rhamnosyl transferase [Lentibacter algarum]|uniref:glycosyltransferase n=1 Tax=Lentibacter algarum TaxID=576131 RepID=UPI001C06D8D4|nr:putative rhamnosyl transferase [Lentibacter algarum]
MKLQVLGLCRWSYPSQVGAFNNKGQSLEALRAELYNARRLEGRLFFMEHLVLPSIRAQSDVDFKLVLMIGDELPDPWRSKLLRLIKDIPQVKPVFLPEGQNHMEACRNLMISERDQSADVVAEFRLDDDDAVASDFVARLRDLFGALRPIYKEHKRVAVDFCRGFLMRCENSGEINYEPVEARLWTPALALYVPPSHKRSLINYPHMRTWRAMPVLSHNKKPMFVRGAHEGNDSEIKRRNVETFRFNLENLPDVMQEDFGVDLQGFETAWRALHANS